MDEFTEKRFGYLKELSNQELLTKINEIAAEIEYLESQLNDSTVSPQEKSEIRNRDLLFEKDRLRYVEYLMKERNIADEKNLK